MKLLNNLFDKKIKSKALLIVALLLAGYVVCARMYVHHFLSQGFGSMTDWESYGSQFTGWFLWLGVAVTGTSVVFASRTYVMERQVMGKALTGVRFLVLAIFLLLAFNTVRFPIRQVRSIPEDVKQDLRRSQLIYEKNVLVPACVPFLHPWAASGIRGVFCSFGLVWFYGGLRSVATGI